VRPDVFDLKLKTLDPKTITFKPQVRADGADLPADGVKLSSFAARLSNFRMKLPLFTAELLDFKVKRYASPVKANRPVPEVFLREKQMEKGRYLRVPYMAQWYLTARIFSFIMKAWCFFRK
jgi:hypothetical protein